MSVLSSPRPRVIADALTLAQTLCNGHIIDGGPALRHAAAVAVTLGEHLPDVSPELVAATLLHDAPEYAGDQLDSLISERLGRQVLELIRAIDGEHQAMANYHADPAAALHHLTELADSRPAVLAASAADKAVSFTAILVRANRADDPATYWATRRPLLEHAPYFRAFVDAAAGVVPFRLVVRLQQLVTRIEAVANAALVQRPAKPGNGHNPDEEPTP